jgi:DNA (cytosine-5)-methyltransferase 1
VAHGRDGVLWLQHSKEWGRNLNDRRERCRRIGVATLAYYDFNSWGVGGHFLIRSGNEVRATASTERIQVLPVRVGSLFTGYGGLDLAVGGELMWYSEIEPAACEILERHFPDVPNLGDITRVDWSNVRPVDVITGGYPCQPFSQAGSRRGEHDERHLWPYVRDAIREVRPEFAILENVKGHITLGLAEVLGDIAELGFDAEWSTFRASDVGACHRRERVFILASDPNRPRRSERCWSGAVKQEDSAVERKGNASPYPSGYGHGFRTNLGGMGWMDSGTEKETQERQRSREKPNSRSIETFTDSNIASVEARINPGHDSKILWEEPMGSTLNTWGDLTEAIVRWEIALNRRAPEPTVFDESKGGLRLNPMFVEWMMGLPEGWVTGHGLSRAKELKMLGNGVVPQQARIAIEGLVSLVGTPSTRS